ncbi:MAG: hypothetical protein Q8R55_06160 [Candidatus Taylorbacteria bacterium]|nr:hypothetical protein [Candidatus Taylorbacteria bacterium]
MLYKYMSKAVAFIDVQNTDTTTKKLLGFEVDWKKLCYFLKNDWQCDKVFFYVGIDEGDLETTNLFEGLRGNGCIVRAKVVFAYKNRDVDLNVTCPKCSNKFIEKVDMGYNRKSNCDVDLTVDAMEFGGPDKEFTSRFSTKLRKLISENPKMVDFRNLDNIRYKIEKK